MVFQQIDRKVTLGQKTKSREIGFGRHSGDETNPHLSIRRSNAKDKWNKRHYQEAEPRDS